MLIELLLNDGVDFIIAPMINGLTVINKNPLGDKIKLSGVVESSLLYHYLHDEHKELTGKERFTEYGYDSVVRLGGSVGGYCRGTRVEGRTAISRLTWRSRAAFGRFS